MKTFFTSDNHFGHKNILKFENRPFSTVEEMDEYMIKQWNNKVSNNDIVYILGDFSFYNKIKTNEILEMLNGKKILITGNHDKSALECKYRFEYISPLHEIKINKINVVLCHYPMLKWNKSHYGSIQLHGHTHSNLMGITNQYNVGVDINNLVPCELEEIIYNNERNKGYENNISDELY